MYFCSCAAVSTCNVVLLGMEAPALNGVYQFSGSFRGRPYYAKPQNGTTAKLYLYYLATPGWWVISLTLGSNTSLAYAAQAVASPDLLNVAWAVLTGASYTTSPLARALCTGMVCVWGQLSAVWLVLLFFNDSGSLLILDFYSSDGTCFQTFRPLLQNLFVATKAGDIFSALPLPDVVRVIPIVTKISLTWPK